MKPRYGCGLAVNRFVADRTKTVKETNMNGTENKLNFKEAMQAMFEGTFVKDVDKDIFRWNAIKGCTERYDESTSTWYENSCFSPPFTVFTPKNGDLVWYWNEEKSGRYLTVFSSDMQELYKNVELYMGIKEDWMLELQKEKANDR